VKIWDCGGEVSVIGEAKWEDVKAKEPAGFSGELGGNDAAAVG
jgi:hypothetical protein